MRQHNNFVHNYAKLLFEIYHKNINILLKYTDIEELKYKFMEEPCHYSLKKSLLLVF